jgi:hypothetical protein
VRQKVGLWKGQICRPPEWWDTYMAGSSWMKGVERINGKKTHGGKIRRVN